MISELPLHELLYDRAESLVDIAICKAALAQGITHHRDGMSVQYRLDTNRKIIETIDREIERRRETNYVDT
jgi:hypothetical protein